MSDEERGCLRAVLSSRQGARPAGELCLAPVRLVVAALTLLLLTGQDHSEVLKNGPSPIP